MHTVALDQNRKSCAINLFNKATKQDIEIGSETKKDDMQMLDRRGLDLYR